ncbi:MAG: hypothetical protein RR470_09390 [Vagococcus sp.]|uniref:hypothetical protein n=1 Tax=Vagococcus sp. TaxID=1933889 RepID=UPI002FCC413C
MKSMSKWTLFNLIAAFIICFSTFFSEILPIVYLNFYISSTIVAILMVNNIIALVKTKEGWNIISIFLTLPAFLFYAFIIYIAIFEISLAP